MGSKPVLRPSEVVDILQKLGFEMVRQRGSHLQFRDAHGRGTTVPAHQDRDIAPPLLRQIAKDIGMSVEEFLTYRCIRELQRAAGPSALGSLRHHHPVAGQ